MKPRNQKPQEKIEIPMTPMIDIVFQLLVFFIMTFKVVSAEGDFNIKMPLGQSPGALSDDIVPPIKLRLRVGSDPNVPVMTLNDTPVAGFDDLRNKIVGIVGHDRGPGSIQDTAEVEIDADYNLQYVHTIDAISAVSGYIDPSTGTLVKMVEKIKFTPPKAPS